MMKKLLAFLLLATQTLFAANHFVRQVAAGSANGNDWTNAYTTLPTPLIRGDTYYIADGTYGGYIMDVPYSGTLHITIKKATIADHGTVGTAGGWDNTFGDGQAIFTGPLQFKFGRWTLDGQTDTPYGFKIIVNDGSMGVWIGGAPIVPQTMTTMTIRYCDIAGTHGDVPHNFLFAEECRCIRIFPYNGTDHSDVTNVTVEHNDLHAVPTIIQMDQSHGVVNTLLFQYNKMHDNLEAPGFDGVNLHAHQNVFFALGTSGVIWRYNEIYRTTAVGYYPNGTPQGALHEIYGNFWHDCRGAGIWVEGANGGAADMRIYNNTFADMASYVYINSTPNATSGFAQNNLIYNFAQPVNWNQVAHDYNWYTNTTNGEAHGVNGGAASPWNVEPMISSTIAANMPRNKGNTLAAQYNTDPNGTIRGADGAWDIGAYEVPIAGTPTLSTATVNPAGTQIAFLFNQTVQAGAGGSAGWTLTGGHALSSLTGVGSNTLTYNISPTVNAGEVLTLTYTQPGNGIEATVTPQTDLASITTPFNVTNNSTAGLTATPQITLPAGPYFGTQTTTITDSDTTNGAVIRYTTDGTTPTASSPVYSAPLTISTNQTIQAIATWTAHANSGIASSAYEVVSWVSPGTNWKTFSVPQQTGTFTWNFSITAPAAASNAVVGIGPSAVSTYAGMACIVQFFGDTINAIAGGAYTTGPAYIPGAVYKFVATVNMTAHTWTLTVTPAAGGATTTIVTNAAFRTEQAAASQLSWIGIQSISGTTLTSAMSFPSGPASARYIGLRGVPASGGATP